VGVQQSRLAWHRPTVVRKNDRVRIRVGNLTMTNHPIHLHGHEFEVTGTDGGWVPKTARWPEVTADVAVGQMRAIEFIANNPGDWAFHCHKSHHTMNPMGHEVPTLIGVKQRDLIKKIGNLVPDYMPMGATGMAEMSEMASMMDMPLPENTLPMMSGMGQFGAIDMGGMFTTVKVRDGLMTIKILVLINILKVPWHVKLQTIYLLLNGQI